MQYTALMYSFSYLEPVYFSMSSSNYCFLTCIQISQEAVKVVISWRLFTVVIYIVMDCQGSSQCFIFDLILFFICHNTLLLLKWQEAEFSYVLVFLVKILKNFCKAHTAKRQWVLVPWKSHGGMRYWTWSWEKWLEAVRKIRRAVGEMTSLYVCLWS